MGVGAHRVDISFDRERRVLRAFADAVARVGRKPVTVGIDGSTSAATEVIARTGEAVAARTPETEPTELERFASELQAKARQQVRERTDRRSNARHGVTRGNVASVVLPEPGTAPIERDATPRRRTSDRVGVGWQATPRANGIGPSDSTAPTPPSQETAPPPPSPPPPSPSVPPLGSTATISPDANARAARYLGALVAAYGPLDPDDAAIDAPLVDVLVLDASALVALARGNARARAHLSRAVGALARIVVPATALVDAAHARVAHAIADVTQVDASIAKVAARLIADTGTNAPSTALAIALAARGDRAAVLTAEVEIANAYARATGAATRPYVLTV